MKLWDWLELGLQVAQAIERVIAGEPASVIVQWRGRSWKIDVQEV